MIKVHDSMPLILEKGQLKDWFDDRKMEQILPSGTGQLKLKAVRTAELILIMVQRRNRKMRMFVYADACPVVAIIEKDSKIIVFR